MPIEGESPLEGLEGIGGTPVTSRLREGQSARAGAPREVKQGPSFAKRGKGAGHVPCWDCIAVMEQSGRWTAPSPAMYEYRANSGAEVRYLCFAHANTMRAHHGLETLKR